MHGIYVPSSGPRSWRAGLADPGRQWREGRSAFELAVDWEAARKSDRGLPPTVMRAMDGVDALRDAKVLIAFPEHKVSLEGGGHASQTDLWVLLNAPAAGLVSAAVEAKAGEPFDQMVSEWSKGAPPGSGKPARLRQLLGLLDLDEGKANLCRYQLLHRTAAALLEAKRFGARHAMLLVQSFASPDDSSFNDYQCFGEQLGVDARRDELVMAGQRGGVELWLGWLSAPASTDVAVRADARRPDGEG